MRRRDGLSRSRSVRLAVWGVGLLLATGLLWWLGRGLAWLSWIQMRALTR